ncbi:FUSC family protein [Enterobacter hormaechei]|nr:FUSC family protein [Enterobacter hormaechei]
MTNMNHSRALKVGTVFTLVFLVVHAIGFKERSWPLITAMVLLIPANDHRHLLNRAFQRICGTLVGAAIGILALQLEKLWSFPAMLPLCFIGAALASYGYRNQRVAYAAVIVAVTMAVIVNAPAGDLHVAMARVMGISIGIVLTSVLGWFLRV